MLLARPVFFLLPQVKSSADKEGIVQGFHNLFKITKEIGRFTVELEPYHQQTRMLHYNNSRNERFGVWPHLPNCVNISWYMVTLYFSHTAFTKKIKSGKSKI